jgi:hypothetical protein
MKQTVTVSAVGDISNGPDPLDVAFANVMEPLRSADIRFGHAERAYSERGQWNPQSGPQAPRRLPAVAAGFKSVPFHVLSIASNHTGDWGPDAVEDTVETFEKLGIPTVGSGRTIAEARRPAIIEAKGLRIAFLGYVSVIPVQTWATDNRAGCAPMRAHTYYEPYEYQPGSLARIVTVPFEDDLENLVSDVKNAKSQADLVFVSLHWGLHFQPKPCDYQPIVAHAAIDAGATAILGHHPHQPQGVEIYKGAVIYYSIGNFTFGLSRKGSSHCLPAGTYEHQEVYSVEPDPGFRFDYRRHWNEGGIAFMEVDREGLRQASYMPTHMNEVGHATRVMPDDPGFAKQMDYLNWSGKFISGGVTDMRPVGDRYEIYAR